MCITKMRNERVNSLATLFQLSPIEHKQLDRVVIIEKKPMIAGFAFRIEEKTRRSFTPHISIVDSQIMVTDPTIEACPKIAGSRLHDRWSIHGSLKYIIIIGSKSSHRSLRLKAKSSDRGNSTKCHNVLVKTERPPKRSLGFSKLRF